MAKPKRDYRSESARRNERARAAGFRNYYEQRLARAQTAHGKRVTRAQARGHGGLGKLQRLRRAIKAAGDEGMVDFIGLDRNADGSWNEGEISVFDGGETRIRFHKDELDLLPRALKILDESGLTLIGGLKYLRQLVDWVEKR